MALLRPRTSIRTDSESVARLQALRDVACQTGREHYVWRARGLRRWRWVAVEAAVDPGDSYESVVGDERTGRTFTRCGAESAARAAFNAVRAEADAVRAATIACLDWRTRTGIRIAVAAAWVAYASTLAAAIGMIICFVVWSDWFFVCVASGIATAWAGDYLDRYIDERVDLARNTLGAS